MPDTTSNITPRYADVSPLTKWVVGGLSALILGSYVFTWRTFTLTTATEIALDRRVSVIEGNRFTAQDWIAAHAEINDIKNNVGQIRVIVEALRRRPIPPPEVTQRFERVEERLGRIELSFIELMNLMRKDRP